MRTCEGPMRYGERALPENAILSAHPSNAVPTAAPDSSTSSAPLLCEEHCAGAGKGADHIKAAKQMIEQKNGARVVHSGSIPCL
jgi:hypothetical protein